MKDILLLLALWLVSSSIAFGQQTEPRIEEVSGKYIYAVSDNDDITLKQAKRKCLVLAKAAAIKEVFGELVTSDVIETNVETNGESMDSYFYENTEARARGEWLEDTEKPLLDIKYEDGKLIFTAEVKGMVREIVQSKIDLKWEILKDGIDERKVATDFESGERAYVKFRSPADGYVAIYLIVGDDETSCLLPYAKDTDGRFDVKAGRDYLFFDKESDPLAPRIKLTTKRRVEDNQLVIIYSPNPFTKCSYVSGDKKRLDWVNTHDFQKWLLNCQREDRDMVVNKKWIKIYQKEEKQTIQ